MKLFFVTSNKNKFEEIKALLSIPMHHIKFEFPEIQGTAQEVIVHKLFKARKHLGKEFHEDDIILMDDSCMHLNGLYGFPGVYAKDFLKIGFDAILEIVTKVGKEVKMTCQLGLLYKNKTKIFVGTADGQIGSYDSQKMGSDFDSITFINKKRLSDLSINEKNLVSARGKACKSLQEFLMNESIYEHLE
ncbi:Inosine triphosphate pyrophosphatase [Pseudoloma neurophilia]|uniref:Inosine triphosphate pyrophosphatase n=1 Tax=Pseudoloma neurophilia TaxID=146866 RepID=A0A0R0M363_9MICR|nr:Inosine triphosphate pyrophosphatase [Pseudoloma neurophilia]